MVTSGELILNFDRSYAYEYYNKSIIDYNGDCLYVSPEELVEIMSADKSADTYQPKQWLYGFYWKIADDADFSKVGIEETLEYTLTNGSTIAYPRHMPIGRYMCLNPIYGYVTVDEQNLIRQSDVNNSLHLSTLGSPSTAVVSQNHIKVFAQSGERPIQMTEVTLESIEQLASYYRRLPHGHEVPTLTTTMHDVKDEVNGIFKIVDTTVVPDLIKSEWEGNLWLHWTSEKLTDLLKRCLQSLTAATNVTNIKSSLKSQAVLTSTSSNWSNHHTFLNYTKAINKVLRANSVMEEDTDKIKPATLTASEHAVIANALFDNLPSSNDMERAFKDVVKVGSTNSDGKFGTIECFIARTTDVFGERLRLASGMRKFGLEGPSDRHDKRGGDINSGNDNKKGRLGDTGKVEVIANLVQQGEQLTRCGGCGYPDGRCGTKETCKYKGHPGFNTENVAWENSTSGKGYLNNTPPWRPNAPKGCTHLVWDYKPDGIKVSAAELNGLTRPIVKTAKSHNFYHRGKKSH